MIDYFILQDYEGLIDAKQSTWRYNSGAVAHLGKMIALSYCAWLVFSSVKVTR